jgi:hypothetical protein
MIKFFDDAAINETMSELVPNSDRADLAVSYWGRGAAERLGLLLSKDTRIVCDLLSGCCNPAEIERIRQLPGVQVRHLAGLHAKVYWTPTMMIVGSANASANGLGDSGEGTIEAATCTDERSALDEAAGWFTRQWDRADPVFEPLMRRGWEAWKSRGPRATSAETATVIQKYLKQPEWFRGRVNVTYYTTEASPEAKKKFEEIRDEYYSKSDLKKLGDDEYPFYDERVRDVPEHLIGNFIIEAASEKLYTIFRIEPYSKDHCVVLLRPERNVLGLSMPLKERKWLRQAIERHLGPKETDRSWDLETLPSDVRQLLAEKCATGSN